MSKAITAAVILFIAALLSLPSLAQDATPTAPPTETPIPTLTLTDPPTPPPAAH